MADSHLYTLLDMFSNAALTFLPILIAVSAAKIFGANIYLGAVIGMIMIHPSLVNAWDVSQSEDTLVVGILENQQFRLPGSRYTCSHRDTPSVGH